jgi:hypothetical protein
VIAIMGDRFVTIRADSRSARNRAATRAISNATREIVMRRELAAAVTNVMRAMTLQRYPQRRKS